MKDTGLIFDIQAFSVHDGPGCRTNVFFVGCPLHCSWCANPENFGDKKHIMFADKVCKWKNGCRACTKICPRDGLSFGEAGPVVNWKVCNQCTTFECVSVCPNGSLKLCGTEYTVNELMKIIKRDFNHWGLDGGVTFTGGEPLRQGEFLLQVLAECEKSQIHTAIETSGFASNEMFLRVFRYLHFAFIA
jgi:pyruvate formate lyase activating enzyme